MQKNSKPRNNLIEFFRFIYSLLVMGYHIQFSYSDDKIDIFENGALAVEFFFILSGYFLPRSLEKIIKDEKTNFIKKVFYFMKNKVTALLNVHLIAIVAVIIIIACCDKSSFFDKFLPGIPSIFLVHMIIVWSSDFEKALIVPEWYLSSMLICMLFMVMIYILFRKKINGIYTTVVLVGIVVIITIISGLATSWKFNENIIYDIRAWGEMCLGMFSYFLSVYVKEKTYGDCVNILLKIIEIIGYCLPVILGIIPISSNYQGYLMAATIICIFCAVFITFAGKGNVIKNYKVNHVFGYLGAISLPIYLFHLVLITLIDYIKDDFKRWVKFVIVFPSTLFLSFLYRIIADLLNKKKKKISEKSKIEEEEKTNIKDESNVKENEKENENEKQNI